MSVLPIYCIDSSSLINLKRFPRVVFEGPWANMELLIQEQRLIAPIQVKVEILGKTDKEDEIAHWVRQNPNMFVEIDNDQGAFITDLYRTFPELEAQAVSPLSVKRADPFLIAVASTRGCCVVTDEGAKAMGNSRHMQETKAAINKAT